MKTLMIAAVAIVSMSAGAAAQTVPDLKGVWSGQFKSIVFGHNPHHPGSPTISDPPRVRDITFTYEVQGQEGRVLWGHSWSDPSRKEPFGAMLMQDGKAIVGSDTDGSMSGGLVAADRWELCYTHTGLGPSKSIITSCGVMQRQR